MPSIPTNEDSFAQGPARFPIVGVGASAGGLEAFSELLREVPHASEMAFVFIQHLDPNHPSLLPELLQRETVLTVVSASDGCIVLPKHVYVIAENTSLTLQSGRLVVGPRGHGPEQFMPIDRFFRSLAADQGGQCVAVVLSGGGTDGALGVEDIKGGDGIVFVQSVQSAKHEAMPRSAIATGCADYVMSPAEIGRELVRLDGGLRRTAAGDFPVAEGELQEIFMHLRRSTGADFANYKRTTIKRRIHRRVQLTGSESVHRYIGLLEKDPNELHALFQDFLIRVTSFFRDPSAFAALQTVAFPALMRDRTVESPIRVWVAGCATGEEVYSLAILLLEYLGDMANNMPLKILATDINEAALQRARAGLYVDNIALDVSPERLQRFFIKLNGYYQISQAVRDVCVFSKHNLAKDPPFANIDLISCRNLLIYFDLQLQKRVIPYFHYALKPNGFLMLGTSESVGGFSNLFETRDSDNKLYSKNFAAIKPRLDFSPAQPWKPESADKHSAATNRAEPRAVDIQREAERLLLARFVPPSVIVDADTKILHFRGEVGRYLNPVTGTASLDLLKMVREELLVTLRDSIESAKNTRAPIKATAYIKDHERAQAVGIEVVPLHAVQGAPLCFIVLFEQAPPAPAPLAVSTSDGPDDSDELEARDRELAALRNYLQSVIEENESTSEELKAANEEILSSNEELQSTNEELQTTKEEMQSTNEELVTVNDELMHRNRDLGHLNDDLINLLGGLNIPFIMVNRDLLIRRYTPPAEGLFNLIATDMGRPISDLRPNLKVPNLVDLIAGVVRTLAPVELDVQDVHDRWYSMRIRPYITTENRVDGAALAMVDIDQEKRGAEQLRASRDYANAIVETIWEPLVVLDRAFNFQRGNASFHRVFKTNSAELTGRSFWEIDNGRWDMPELRDRLPEALQRTERLQGIEVEQALPDGERKTFSLSAQRIVWDDDQKLMLLLAIEDITDRARALQQAKLLVKEQAARATAETASRMKDEFLAMLAHELRNPLAPVRNTLYILRKRFAEDPVARSAVELSQRQVSHMARLLDDLLDVSRITRGRIHLRRELVELQSAVNDAIASNAQHFESNQQNISVRLPDEPIYLEADPARVQQILSNLLHNAAKYTHRHGRISVDVKLEADLAAIHIKDDGVGIDAQMLSRVFDLFAQVDRSLDRAQGGLGIGLTLVKNLVSLHGGTVEAHSRGLNHGSEFIVRLPTIALTNASRKAAKSASDNPAPQRRVLVVDDNEDAATTLKMALEIHGHKVETADGPHEAIATALENKPDFILLDIGLPGMDGYAVATRLRQDSGLDHTIIVAITGYGNDEDRRRSKEAGIDYHLVKPTDMREVTRLLREAERVEA